MRLLYGINVCSLLSIIGGLIVIFLIYVLTRPKHERIFIKRNFWVLCNYYRFWIIFLCIGIGIYSTSGILNILDTAIAGIIGAIIGAIIPYRNFITDKKMQTLSEYNRRFTESKVMRKVTIKIESIEYNNSDIITGLHLDEELFYRFFEEIELNIERGILKSRDVYNLFAYYALDGIINKKLIPYDYPQYWQLLKKFIYRMEPLFLNKNQENKD